MKKLLLTVSALAALTMLAPTSSFAQANLECIGLYFTGGASCTTGAFLAHVPAYVVYLNPTISETRGFECGFDLSSPTLATFNTAVSITFPTPATNVGVVDNAAGTYNYIVGYGSPLVISGLAVTLGTLDVFVLDNGPIEFTLRASIPSSDPADTNPVVLRPDFTEKVVGMHQATSSPNLILNPSGGCDVILPSEDMSFGAVKSLFR